MRRTMAIHEHPSDEVHEHDLGLAHDLPRMVSRRQALGVFATGLGTFALAACGSDDNAGTAGSTSTQTEASSGDSAVPEETAGPFPGDGSNGPDVLGESGVVRQDITTSFGDFEGTAEGVPTTLELSLIDVAGGGGPLAGAAVYVWHCTREGAYSLYEGDVVEQNFLRGVQESDSDGKLSFETIYPACYAGRWPHIHFEVYENLDAAAAANPKLRTSQIALPGDFCEELYGSADGYEQSVSNLSQLSIDTDGIFADGYSSQLANATGSVDEGVTLSLNVGV